MNYYTYRLPNVWSVIQTKKEPIEEHGHVVVSALIQLRCL